MSLRWVHFPGSVPRDVLFDSMDQQIAEVFEVDREHEWHYNILDIIYGVEYGEGAEDKAKQMVMESLGIRIQL